MQNYKTLEKKKKLQGLCPDFGKLRIKFKGKLRNGWVGDWDARKNEVIVYKNLKDADRVGVIVHEFIEMIASAMMEIPDCCDSRYKQGKHGAKNELAHNLANRVERKILELGGYSWRAHQKRCRELRKKTKVDKVEV